MKRVIWLLWLTGLALILAGCISARHRLYEGPALPRDEVAIVKGSYPVRLYGVDGRKRPGSLREYGSILGDFRIELLPGTHTFTVGYSGPEGFSLLNVTLELELEAGATYKITADVREGYWDPVRSWYVKYWDPVVRRVPTR